MSERITTKQIGNRILEPWMWITIIVSATNFENLFALRCHPATEPHFQNLAYKARTALDNSIPNKLEWGQWHLPLIYEEDLPLIPENFLPNVSAGRCARVSFLTHEGKRDWEADKELCQRLTSAVPLHASPLEHPAQAVRPPVGRHVPVNVGGVPITDWGNFDPGWLQLRKMYNNENITKRLV